MKFLSLYIALYTCLTTPIYGMDSLPKNFDFFIPVDKYRHSIEQITMVEQNSIRFPYKFLPKEYFDTRRWSFVPENSFIKISQDTFGITNPLRPCIGVVLTDCNPDNADQGPTTLLAHITYRTNVTQAIAQLAAQINSCRQQDLHACLYSNQLTPVNAQQWRNDFNFDHYQKMAEIAHTLETTWKIKSENITVDFVAHHISQRIKDALTQLFRVADDAVTIQDTSGGEVCTLTTFKLSKDEVQPAFDAITILFKSALCLGVDHIGKRYNVSTDIIKTQHKLRVRNTDGSFETIEKIHFPCTSLHSLLTHARKIPFSPNSSPLYEVQTDIYQMQEKSSKDDNNSTVITTQNMK